MENLVKNNKAIQILTDTGWSSFDGVLYKGIRETVIVKTRNSQLSCTLDHEFFTPELKKLSAKQLRPGIKIKNKNTFDVVVSVALSISTSVYDLLNVEKNHRFFANDLLISNCKFLIADETLINPNTLIQLEGIEPIEKIGQIRWYKRPEKGNIYCVGLDPSLGTGGDPAAIQIYEANTTTQIGEWRHNKTDIPSQIKLLAQINKYIVEKTNEPNNLYYSIENNSIGEAALVSLNEYGESIIPGVFLSEAGKKRKGFNTTNKVKLTACAKFKTLLESKKLTVYSKALVSELKGFVASGGSYAAKIGDTDDLVMASLLVVRMFQHLSDYHMNLEEQIRDHEEFVAPLPFFAVLG